MKNRVFKAIIALAAFVIVPQAQAYRYSFSNHTTKKIAAAIKFKGSKWYEFCVIQPGQMNAIAHGNKYAPDQQTDFPSASAGLVPSQMFYYLPKAGELMTTKNQQTVAWRAINIEWIPSESYTIAIELAEGMGKAGSAIGKAGMKAGAAYMTAGTSEVANAASKMTTAKADALKDAASGSYGLSSLIGTIGKSAARSLIGDHHIDIVEDEDGKIHFISLL